jgi:hypothetical protein
MDHSFLVPFGSTVCKYVLDSPESILFPGSYVKLSSAVRAILIEGPNTFFGREPSNDYFINILFLLSKWFQTRRFLWEFPIGCPNLNCISIMMSFLTYIMGIFMNFELLPILTDYPN